MTITQQPLLFTLPIGKSIPEALGVLQAIKNSMGDILWQHGYDETSANDETIIYVKRIYREAKLHIRKLKAA